MAAFLRSPRVLLQLNRSAAQPACLVRPLCRVPPEDSGQNGEAKKAAAAVKKDESEEKISQGQNVDTQTEGYQLSEEIKENKDGEFELHESIVKEKDDVDKKDKSKAKKTFNQKKLHDLLSSLATADPIPVEPSVRLSHPKAKKKKAKASGKITPPTESEPDLKPELVSAAKDVAESLGGDVNRTESELLSTLRLHSTETTTNAAPSLSELFVGMKVERKPKSETGEVPHHLTSDSQVRHPHHLLSRDQPLPRRSFTQPSSVSMPRTRVDLFGGKPLGIFNKSQDKTPVSVVPTWERLHLHELQHSTSHPPSNAFIEMINWTNEGKLWTFPVDNEAGLEEEKKIGFHEHIFLEKYLEDWCPQRGPIRHFMELVCVGLSKNPHITIQRKQAHIEWYKNYFKQKEDLLKELGAIEVSQ